MSNQALQHRRVHNLLLIEKLLAIRGESSPFTLILDSVEQSSKQLVAHYVNNAKASKTSIVYVSYETLQAKCQVDTFIKARRKDPAAVVKEVSSYTSNSKRTLIILDTLYPLAANPTLNLPAFLSSLITPTTSLLAIYHTDIPLPTPPSPYAPTPLTQLKYLATTILTTHSFPQVLARKRASEKSLAEPVFGLAEEKDGVIVGLGANDPRGLVLEMNHRRKSGRGIEEWFFLPPVASKEKVMLLSDHPLYRQAENGGGERRSVADEVATEMSTFNLGITEKQRRDREGVVLPYFDAQSGGGEGGRILYDMGVEDDFDEEEDEI